MKRILLSLLLVGSLTTFETRPILPLFTPIFAWIGQEVCKLAVIAAVIEYANPGKLDEIRQQKPQKLDDMSQVIEAKKDAKGIQNA